MADYTKYVLWYTTFMVDNNLSRNQYDACTNIVLSALFSSSKPNLNQTNLCTKENTFPHLAPYPSINSTIELKVTRDAFYIVFI